MKVVSFYFLFDELQRNYKETTKKLIYKNSKL